MANKKNQQRDKKKRKQRIKAKKKQLRLDHNLTTAELNKAEAERDKAVKAYNREQRCVGVEAKAKREKKDAE